MAINKMIFAEVGGIDLTGDTATEQDVAQGKTFHKANGEQAVGTAQIGGDTFADLYLKNIPSTTYENLEATRVNAGAFYMAQITSVNLPSVKEIRDSGFSKSLLTSIYLPEVTNLYQSSFESCSNLTSIDMPKLTNIQSNVFRYCTRVSSINLPNLKIVGNYAFYNCGDAQANSFSLQFPSLTTMLDCAFRDMNKLVSIEVPILEKLGAQCLNQTEVEEFTIPATCTQVGNYTFSGNTFIKKIICENDFTTIPNYFYNGGTALTELSFLGNTSVPTLSSTTHLVIPTNCVIKVPIALETEWKQATNWSVYASQIVGV